MHTEVQPTATRTFTVEPIVKTITRIRNTCALS